MGSQNPRPVSAKNADTRTGHPREFRWGKDGPALAHPRSLATGVRCRGYACRPSGWRWIAHLDRPRIPRARAALRGARLHRIPSIIGANHARQESRGGRACRYYRQRAPIIGGDVLRGARLPLEREGISLADVHALCCRVDRQRRDVSDNVNRGCSGQALGAPSDSRRRACHGLSRQEPPSGYRHIR